MHLQIHTYLTPTYKSRVILIKCIVMIYSKFAIMFLCQHFHWWFNSYVNFYDMFYNLNGVM